MRQMHVYGPQFVSIVFSMSIVFAPSQRVHAQTDPNPGTIVTVRMIDAVNSAADPAGKQYRASVTKTVTAGNGVTIPQAATATVSLASNGSGYIAQLSSITINGQPVAVASSSSSVTSAAQSAAGSAVNAVNSVLGGFGHHVSAPAGVAAVATGQRVFLPPGTTLSFVLSQPPASSDTMPAAQPAAAQPTMAVAAAAPTPAGSPAAANGRYVFCSTGHYASAPTNSFTSATEPATYFSEIFPETINYGLHVSVDWNNFLQQKSLPHAQAGCDDAIGLSAAQAKKQQKEDEYRKEKKQVMETGWTYEPGAAPASATPTQATTATAYYKECAALFGNIANEHCGAAANEYYVYCSSANLDGPVVYFSDIFAFNKDVSSGGLSADLAPSFLLFLETKYGVKVSNDFYPTSRYTGGSYPTDCSRSFMTLSYARSMKQLNEDSFTKSLHKQIIETGWKSSIAPLPPVTAPPAAANEHYVFCYSDKVLPVQYFSEIFAAVPAGDSISNTFLAFLQKKYGFNDTRPGSPVTCDVSPKAANAYMFQTEWSVRQNMEGLGDANRKPIETGWKYTP